MSKNIKITVALVAASILGLYLFMSPSEQAEVPHMDSNALKHNVPAPTTDKTQKALDAKAIAQAPAVETLVANSKEPAQIPDSPKTEAAKPESQPASESKQANGKFGLTNTEELQFHSSVINISQIKKDQLSKIINGFSIEMDKANGRFFVSSGNEQKFSANFPTMTPLSKDDYDHVILTLRDKGRSKHGFVFHFGFNIWKQSIDDKKLIKLMNDVNLQKDDIKLAFIRGHADSIGTDQKNFEISTKRAAYIMKMLPSVKVIVEPVGENEPVADNDTAEGRALNRRAELIFIMKSPDDHSINGAQIL